MLDSARIDGASDFRLLVRILTVAPIVAVYPFVQRHFVKGVLIGAVKG